MTAERPVSARTPGYRFVLFLGLGALVYLASGQLTSGLRQVTGLPVGSAHLLDALLDTVLIGLASYAVLYRPLRRKDQEAAALRRQEDAEAHQRSQADLREDVTARQRTEAALRASEERARLLLGAITDAVFVHGFREDGRPDRFVEVNDIACARLGYAREELTRLGPLDIDAPGAPIDLAAIGAELARGGIATFDQVHVARDGRRIPVEITSRTFTLDGKPAVISVVRDVTERRRFEDELRRRDRILEGVAVATSVLLTPGEGRKAIAEALARVGEAACVHRVYLLEGIHDGPGPMAAVKLTDEWCAPGIEPQLGKPEMARIELTGRFGEWLPELEAGRAIEGRVDELPPPEKTLLTAQAVRSFLLLPVAATGRLWGCIGFDDCGAGRTFSAPERDALRVLAASLGNLQERERAERTLRALSARLLSVQENERRAFARELHDGLGQTLTALGFGLKRLVQHPPESPALLVSRLEELSADLGRTIDDVRDMTRRLRPASLDLGLVPALESETAAFQRKSGIPCFLQAPRGTLPLDQVRSVALFRIVQEALTNVVRHAKAASVFVRIAETHDTVTLEVVDDGQGFDEAVLNSETSLGIVGLRERVAPFGGSLEITRRSPHGTRVLATIPRGTEARA